jgi:O-antigen ligase
MFWKIALGLGVFGLILSVIFIIIAVRAFYASTNPNTEDIAFGGLLISIILLVFSFLLAAVSAIFVLRNSKKEWDAKNLK